MDFRMPQSQKTAWNELKRAVNEYAEITGSEIGVVTSYTRQEADDSSLTTEKSLALHGHGDILRRLRGCLELIKNKSSSQKPTDNGVKQQNLGSNMIPIKQQPVQGEETHYSQAVARSLCSSFQSLKLEPLQFGQFSSSRSTASGSNNVGSDSVKKGNKRTRKKNDRTVNGGRGDGLELDENLLFEEEDDQQSASDDSDESDFIDSDEDDSDNDVISRPHAFGNHNAPQQPSVIHRTLPNTQQDYNQFATSLPVNISANFATRLNGPSRFIDNQGPHPTMYQRTQQQPHAPTTTYANRPRPIQHGFQDTPNPETMMASMQALARSVTDDSSRIFGERPRPRLNTGEQRQVRAHH